MTRKDYEILADAFAVSRPNVDAEPDVYEGWFRAIVKVCDALEIDNPRFSRQLFQFRATGLPVEEFVR
jgi:hypothetical protein